MKTFWIPSWNHKERLRELAEAYTNKRVFGSYTACRAYCNKYFTKAKPLKVYIQFDV